MPHKVGLLFAAAVAGWAIVAGVATFVWLVQVVFSAGVASLPYLLPMTVIAVLASFLAAIPICMALGLLALAVTHRLKLEKRWQWALAGILVGLVIVFGLATVPTPIAPMIVAPVVGLFVAAGAIAGTVAWREYRNRTQQA